ncbi:MAG: hypothetical protein HY321_18390 [Armatimonadetes bacterium]|nr:hypothetical protein [Armatimonadota bacterium]
MVRARARLALPPSLLLLGCLIAPWSGALANGEASEELVNSGIIVPVDARGTHVLDQRVEITLPKHSMEWRQLAEIRVTYVLRDDYAEKARKLMVAWPTGGIAHRTRTGPMPIGHALDCPVSIKQDGKPVGYKVLDFDDLAAPYIRGWLHQIDELLKSKPQLREQVLLARRAAARKPPTGWAYALGQWMQKNHLLKPGDPDEEWLAAGLVGVLPDHEDGRLDRLVQRALKWLQPSYQRMDLYEVLVQRWGYRPLLLDPATERLHKVYYESHSPPDFGIIRFPVYLQPRKRHTLVVHYKQHLSWVDRPPSWHGMAYLMEPAKRWGIWDKTTIVIRVPPGWKKVAIRPPARRTRGAHSESVYTITIRGFDARPYEDLYISLAQQPRPRRRQP